MSIFKSTSQKWFPVGEIGPFSITEDIPDDQAHIVECTARDVHNIWGSEVLRFDPPRLRFVTENATESHSMKMFLHASFPRQITSPGANCQVYNKSRHENSMTGGGNDAKSAIKDDDNHYDHNDEWLLISHLVAPIPQLPRDHKPTPKSLYQFKCQLTIEGTKVKPDTIFFDGTNYSEPSTTYMALRVHSSFPDDRPITAPNCKFSVLDEGRLRPRKDHNVDDTSSDPTRRAVLANYLGVLVLMGSILYLFCPSWFSPNTILMRMKSTRQHTPALKTKYNPSKRPKAKTKTKKQQKEPNHPTATAKSIQSSKNTPPVNSSSAVELKDYLIPDGDDSSNDEDDEEATQVDSVKKQTTNHLASSALEQEKGEQESVVTKMDDWRVVDQVVVSPSKSNSRSGSANNLASIQINKDNNKRDATKTLAVEDDKEEADTTTETGIEDDTPQASMVDHSPLIEKDTTPQSNKNKPQGKTVVQDNKQENITNSNIQLHEFTLFVDGMTCQCCEQVVRNTLKNLNNVASEAVSWKEAKATIRSQVPRLDIVAVANAMEAVGFNIFMEPSTTPTIPASSSSPSSSQKDT